MPVNIDQTPVIPRHTPSGKTDDHAALVQHALMNNFTGDSARTLARAGIAKEGKFAGRNLVAVMGADNFAQVRKALDNTHHAQGVAGALQYTDGPATVSRLSTAPSPGGHKSIISATGFADVYEVLETEIIPGRDTGRQGASAVAEGVVPDVQQRGMPDYSEPAGAASRSHAGRIDSSQFATVPDAMPESFDFDLGTSGSNASKSNVTTARDTKLYWRDLTPTSDRSLGDEVVARFNDSPRDGLTYLSKNVNPGKFGGMVKNFLKILLNPLRSRKVLKQNCISCAKAVDANLAQLAANSRRAGGIEFYQTKSASEGVLDQVERSALDSSFAIEGKHNAPELLRAKLPPGKAAIITVPFKQRGFSHAMNLIHSRAGGMFVIDGQNGKTYDLNNPQDSKRFQDKYWNASGSKYPSVASIFVTGEAPDIR